jgi:hypothetical protein
MLAVSRAWERLARKAQRVVRFRPSPLGQMPLGMPVSGLRGGLALPADQDTWLGSCPNEAVGRAARVGGQLVLGAWAFSY